MTPTETRKTAVALIPVLLLLLTGCPRVIPGNLVRVINIDTNCRGVVFHALIFQGDNAIGNFDFTVSERFTGEFVIPQAIAQRIDPEQPVKISLSLQRDKQNFMASSISCFLKGRTLIFQGKLVPKGTDKHSGNPLFLFDFWDDFKIDYR